VRTDRFESGESVVIRPQTNLKAHHIARIIIGNDVLIGSGAHFYATNYWFDRPDMLIAAQVHTLSKTWW
jgi:acetyltransferase-like isoleucine patch superfamily enzyme